MRLLPILALIACNDTEYEGTVVGNPGDAVARLAPADEALDVEEAVLTAGALVLLGCTAGVEAEQGELDEEIDLLAAGSLGQLDAGTWCGLILEGPVYLDIVGQGPEEAEWSVELALDELALTAEDPGFVVDGGLFVLELGTPGWLSAEALALEEDPVDYEADHPVAVALAQDLAASSSLFEDAERDGQVSDLDRAEGLVASAEGAPGSAGDTGSADGTDGRSRGCGSAAFVLFPGLFLGLRRRRPT